MSTIDKHIENYNALYAEQPMLRPKIGSVKLNVSLGVAGDPLEKAKKIIQTSRATRDTCLF